MCFLGVGGGGEVLGFVELFVCVFVFFVFAVVLFFLFLVFFFVFFFFWGGGAEAEYAFACWFRENQKKNQSCSGAGIWGGVVGG